jgi:hypothetical protein
MATDAQKTPMPATIKPCCDVREGGGTSGIRIFLGFDLIVMREPLEHLKCHPEEPLATERSYAFKSLLRINGNRDCVSAWGE